MLFSKEAVAAILVSSAFLVCVPELLSSSPPDWATKPDASKVERAADEGAVHHDDPANLAVPSFSTKDPIVAMRALLAIASAPVLEACIAELFSDPVTNDHDLSPVSWMTQHRESELDRFCAKATLRGSLVRKATQEHGEVRVANLNGTLVRENDSVGAGLIVEQIGPDFIELREGTRTRRVLLASSSLASTTGGTQ